jgi:carbon monoxide dehydrogenase subunit G
MMEFTGDFTSDHDADELWSYFTDPDVLEACAPGCESMTLVSPSRIDATLAVGVGSVKPSFDVTATVTEYEKPRRLGLEATGEASRNSFAVTALLELAENGDGSTTASWTATANVSGLVASMGERALGSVSTKLVNDFFEDLEALVDEGAGAESKLRAAEDDPEVDADEVGEVAADGDGEA